MGSVGNQLYAGKVVCDTLKGSDQTTLGEELTVDAKRCNFSDEVLCRKKLFIGGRYFNTHLVDVSGGASIQYFDSEGNERTLIDMESITAGTDVVTLGMGSRAEELQEAVITIANTSTGATMDFTPTGTFIDGSSYTPGLLHSSFPYSIPPQTTIKFSLHQVNTWRIISKGTNAP